MDAEPRANIVQGRTVGVEASSRGERVVVPLRRCRGSLRFSTREVSHHCGPVHPELLGEVVDGVAREVSGNELVDFCGLELAAQLAGWWRSRPLDAGGGVGSERRNRGA